MNDVKELLDRRARSFDPSPEAWEGMVARAGRRHRNRRLGAALVALVLFGGVTAGAWVALGQGPDHHPAVPAARRLVTTTLPVRGGVTDVAFGDGSLWVPTLDETVVRMAPDDGRTLATIPVPGVSDYRYVAVGEGGVWVIDGGTSTLTQIDPNINRVVGSLRLPSILDGITTGGGYVWITTVGDQGGELVRVDPATTAVVGDPIRVGDGPGPMVFVDGALWVVNTNGGGSLMRIDPNTARVTGQWFTNRSPSAVAAGDGSVWVSVHPFLVRLDPATGRTIQTLGALGVSGLDAQPNALWTVRQTSSTAPGLVAALDPSTAEVIAEGRAGVTPVGITGNAGVVWVANFYDSTVTRVELSE